MVRCTGSDTSEVAGLIHQPGVTGLVAGNIVTATEVAADDGALEGALIDTP